MSAAPRASMRLVDGTSISLISFNYHRNCSSSIRDPVTGLGVLNFTAFYETAMNLQLTFNPTAAPTIAPTAAPTRSSELSAAPTIAPTRQPPLIQFIGVQVL
jgi:hypothetical protein